jgi:hypothetical protein
MFDFLMDGERRLSAVGSFLGKTDVRTIAVLVR